MLISDWSSDGCSSDLRLQQEDQSVCDQQELGDTRQVGKHRTSMQVGTWYRLRVNPASRLVPDPGPNANLLASAGRAPDLFIQGRSGPDPADPATLDAPALDPQALDLPGELRRIGRECDATVRAQDPVRSEA